MTATATSRLVRIVAAAALTVVAFAGFSSPASAGGWAVASLDSIPAAEPGATTEVSFTILQHGITPADLDEGVGIEFLDHSGTRAFFPAVSDGTAGHYVATVTFPETAGTYEWQVQMGWFGPHELGTLDVQSAETTPLGVWSTIRWLTLAGSLLLAGIAVADMVFSRRRPLAIG
jgi:hypothetical protein